MCYSVRHFRSKVGTHHLLKTAPYPACRWNAFVISSTRSEENKNKKKQP